jgi:hypothetical protein
MVVAPVAQQATQDEIRAKALEMRLTFPVVESASVRGSAVGEIPHCYLFGHDGRCLYDGHSSGVEGRLRAAVGRAMLANADLADPTPAVAPLLDALTKGQPPAGVLQKAIPLQRSAEPATAEQASRLIAALTEAAQKRVGETDALAESDPVEAFERLVRISTTFRGTPVAERAGQQLARLRGSPEVMTEMRARPSLEAIRRLDAALRTGAGAARAPGGPPRQMSAILEQMKRNWPEARSTREAAAIVEKYGTAGK